MPNATESLIPELTKQLVEDPSVPTEVLQPVSRLGLMGGLLDLHSFAGSGWWAHKRVWGCRWDQPGVFAGQLSISPLDGRNYKYTPIATDPFRFQRQDGTVVVPGAMVTDAGSVPRICWAIPGLDPWTYLPAYVLHDWLFLDHHCNAQSPWSFEDANAVLAEAIYTQMTTAGPPYRVAEDWRVAWAIHTAVSSPLGRRVWSREWTEAEKQAALRP